ncbi:MAG: aldo/keto reductase [Xanthomonadales bacterium]|jgi:predicted oxidoreductase|nr:aldo/keto reductase [Xanthomonadales bacterium]
MKTTPLGKGDLVSSRLVYGCMRIAGDQSPEDRLKGKDAIRAAIAEGYTHFDHADIYGGGACESIFAEVLAETPGLRENLLVTGKCGIRLPGQPRAGCPKRYDFSREHILGSVEDSLRRLGTDYMDLLLLHRPDFLFNPADVAETFRMLQASGKVRRFGVSNFRPSQLSMLQAFCDEPLLVNQVEINIHRIDALNDGTLDQCLQEHITPMAWCPLAGIAYPAWGNTLTESQSAMIHAELALQGDKYEAEPWIVMLAWLLRHPARIVPIIGSTRPDRIRAAKQSLELDYGAEDWYRLLQARNGEELA